MDTLVGFAQRAFSLLTELPAFRVLLVLCFGLGGLSGATCPVIRTSLTDQEIDPSQTTEIHVWVELFAKSARLPGKVKLIFSSNKLTYVDKSEVVLDVPQNEPPAGGSASGKEEIIKLSFSKDARGLATLSGTLTSWPVACPQLEQVINIGGFRNLAVITSDLVHDQSSAGTREHLVGDDGEKLFNVYVRDHTGQPFGLGAPVTFIFTAPFEIKLSKGDGVWCHSLAITSKGNKLGTFQLKLPKPGAEKNARITISGTIAVQNGSLSNASAQSTSILDGDLIFDYDYIWWIRLVAIIGGCLAYSLVEALTAKTLGKFTWSSFSIKVVLIIALGGLAFLVEDEKFLGFEIDRTTLKGEVLFGFLVGCLRLEGIVNRVREWIHQPAPSQPTPMNQPN